MGTVTLSKLEYEVLVRESETLSVIRTLARKSKYVSTDDLRIILGIKEESEEKENGN